MKEKTEPRNTKYANILIIWYLIKLGQTFWKVIWQYLLCVLKHHTLIPRNSRNLCSGNKYMYMKRFIKGVHIFIIKINVEATKNYHSHTWNRTIIYYIIKKKAWFQDTKICTYAKWKKIKAGDYNVKISILKEKRM